MGITYDGANHDLSPIGYCDSDYASCIVNRRSTSGYSFHLAGGAVSWRSKQQTSTAVSSVEAEYIAMCSATKQALWLSRLLSDLSGRPELFVIKIKVDNQGAISIAKNTIDNDRTKHIDVQYHFTREKFEQNKVDFEYCPTSDMVADTLTKPLLRVNFEKFRIGLGLRTYTKLQSEGEC